MRFALNGRFLTQDVTGVQRVALDFLAALDASLAGSPGLHQVEVWAPAESALVSEPTLHAVRLRLGGRLRGHAWEQLELPRLVGRQPMLCLGNLAPASRLLSGRAPVFTMVHDLSYKYFPSAYSRSFRLLYHALMPIVLARSAHVFTVSETERASITKHYGGLCGADRLTAVQNGGGEGAASAHISDDPASLLPGHADVPARDLRDRMCLYVGSLTRRKNAAGIIDTAIRLVRRSGMTFVVVGGTGSSFEGHLSEIPRDVVDKILFTGQINDHEELERLYRRASAFVFPSFYEASPLPVIEAMRFGCPVVSSDIPSLRERCGEAVRYVDPHRVADIAAGVEEVMSDAGGFEARQVDALRHAERYLWGKQVQVVLGQMEKVS